jgi:hypothetical protein
MVVFRSRRCYGGDVILEGGYRGDVHGVPVLVIIGVALIVLAPAKQSGELGIGSRCVGSHSKSAMRA